MKLVIHDINKNFINNAKQTLCALKDINLTIDSEEFVALVGPSGCGKSTLLNLVAGLLEPTSGNIVFEELEISNQIPSTALVFQETGLFPWRNVYDNIAFSLEAKGIDKQKQKTLIEHYIKLVGLTGFEKTFPHQLSGGMKQRVGIARALVIEPNLLLMDEPFSALDAQSRTIMQEELITLWEKTRLSTLYVTHNIEEAVMLADRVVVLSKHPGSIIETIPIGVPRNERNSPHNSTIIKTLIDRIWENISNDARCSFLEVQDND